VRVGDGSRGWAEHAPFAAMLVTAAADVVPPALLEQLADGGRMVLPVGGSDSQELTLVRKTGANAIEQRALMPVRFTRLETA
jgi:protein-L-isoaspartate(D-aspartate) O-methyltransferase